MGKSFVIYLLLLVLLTGCGGSRVSEYSKAWKAYKNENYKAAASILRSEAKRGHADAQNFLGTMYEGGEGVKQSYKQALKWYRRAADQGNGWGHYNLGDMYYGGLGVEQNYEEALSWYRKAANIGSKYSTAESKTKVAEMERRIADDAKFERGKQAYKNEDYEIAFEIWKPLAELGLTLVGYSDAQYWFGELYYDGLGVEQNYEVAKGWWKEAADQGHVAAQGRLNEVKEHGSEFENGKQAYKNKDYKTAFIIFKILAAQGHAEAQYELGGMYYKGNGIEQSHLDAHKWWKRAADQGHAEAQYHLGAIYVEKKFMRDLIVAYKWASIAKANGSNRAEELLNKLEEAMASDDIGKAKLQVRDAYRNGVEGVEQNDEEALKWYIKAAEGGYVEAQYDLGKLYHDEKDYDEAVRWWEKAAGRGHLEAQYTLGIMYYDGEKVEQNHKKAAKWYRKAAEQGHLKAQSPLAEIYESGQGVIRNYKEAFKWRKKVAERGDTYAQFLLAIMYYGGKGVEKDFIQAYMWASIVELNGGDNAKELLAILEKEMTSENISEAQNKAKECEESEYKNCGQ